MSAIPNTVSFDSAARIPVPGDNVAIATRRLEGGTVISTGETDFELSHTVMEGHRFVLEPIAEGGNLLSFFAHQKLLAAYEKLQIAKAKHAK